MTLRNAPLSGQDGGSCRDDLPDGLSEIFLQTGLDRANQIDPVQQFRRCAQVRRAGWSSVARMEPRGPRKARLMTGHDSKMVGHADIRMIRHLMSFKGKAGKPCLSLHILILVLGREPINL
jgi:hypothetical protein